MYWKKLLLIGLIFMLFLSSANAIVVSEISDQIDQGNKKIIENNAKISSDVSQLKEQIKNLQQTIDVLNDEGMKKSDIPLVKRYIDYSMSIWQQQLLIMFLALIFFTFLILAYAKGKGVV